MKRPLFILMFTLACTALLHAQVKSPGDSPEARMNQLEAAWRQHMKEHQAAELKKVEVWKKKAEEAKANGGKLPAMPAYSMTPPPGDFIQRFQKAAEDLAGTDGAVLFLSCTLVPANKLEPKEGKRAYKLVRDHYKRVGLLDELAGWSWGPARDHVQEDINHRHGITLRVRLNPGATFTVTGRWMDDGQFIFPYYEYLLGLAAKEAGAELGTYCL